MPDIKKSIKFKDQQNKIIKELYNLLPLDDSNSFTLYTLEQPEYEHIRKQILDMIPDIKKYFSINNMKSVSNPNKSHRSWLCITRSILKQKYTIFMTDCYIKMNENKIKTRRYTFIQKPT